MIMDAKRCRWCGSEDLRVENPGTSFEHIRCGSCGLNQEQLI